MEEPNVKLVSLYNIRNHLHLQKFRLCLYSGRFKETALFTSLIQKYFIYHGDICCFLINQNPLPHFSVRATSFMWVPISPMER